MNEQLQELIRQSVVPAEQAGDYAQAKGLIEPKEKLDVAKFAELIVRECMDVTDAHTEVFQTDRDKALIEHIKQSVKTHFGVEE